MQKSSKFVKNKVHLTQDTLDKLEAENDIEEAIGF